MAVSSFAIFLWCFTVNAPASVLYQTGFELPTYSVGDLNGQDGWVTDIGPANGVQVRKDGPRVGAQAMRMFASGGGRGIRNLSYDATNSLLTVNSRIVFTSGARSDVEFNSVFGTGGFLGGLRVLGTNEFVLETSLGSFSTGFFADFSFSPISLEFDFTNGLASATYKGATIASGVTFDSSNSLITQVAAGRYIIPRIDAVQIDEFSVIATVPEPATLAMMGLGLAGIGYRRHRSKTVA